MAKVTMDIYSSKTYLEDLRTAAAHTVGISELVGRSVLVTGASGTIGSFIADTLLCYAKDNNANLTVIVAGRSTEKLEKRFSAFKGEDFFKAVRLDILEDSLEGIDGIKADYIIHAAGNAYPSAFMDHTEDTVRGNILGTARLLDYAGAGGCSRFVYVSSGEVYSLSDDGHEGEKLKKWRKCRKENSADYYDMVLSCVKEMGPRSCYPVSKLAAEVMCLEPGIDSVIVRPCHTFGPGITGGDDRAHVQFALKAIAGEDIVLNSPGLQERSYNYAADAAAGILSAMIRGQAGKAYDICTTGNVITIRGLAQLIGEKTGVNVTAKEPDERDKMLMSPINRQVLDPNALESLGFTGAYDLKKGVSSYIDVLREIDYGI